MQNRKYWQVGWVNSEQALKKDNSNINERKEKKNGKNIC